MQRNQQSHAATESDRSFSAILSSVGGQCRSSRTKLGRLLAALGCTGGSRLFLRELSLLRGAKGKERRGERPQLLGSAFQPTTSKTVKKPHRKRGALCHPGDPGLFSFEFRKRIQHPSDRFVCPYALLTHTQLSPTTTTTTTAALFADSTVEIRICHCASSFGGAWRIAIGGCGVVR